jgi:hypothetical protein
MSDQLQTLEASQVNPEAQSPSPVQLVRQAAPEQV